MRALHGEVEECGSGVVRVRVPGGAKRDRCAARIGNRGCLAGLVDAQLTIMPKLLWAPDCHATPSPHLRPHPSN